jgi:hypothetical protein
MRRFFALSAVLGVVALLFAGHSTAISGDALVPYIIADQNGDTNADGAIDIADPIYLLQHVYLGGPAPAPLFCEPFADAHNGDVNGDGALDTTDAIVLLHWLFLDGVPPVEGCPGRVMDL